MSSSNDVRKSDRKRINSDPVDLAEPDGHNDQANVNVVQRNRAWEIVPFPSRLQRFIQAIDGGTKRNVGGLDVDSINDPGTGR